MISYLNWRLIFIRDCHPHTHLYFNQFFLFEMVLSMRPLLLFYLDTFSSRFGGVHPRFKISIKLATRGTTVTESLCSYNRSIFLNQF